MTLSSATHQTFSLGAIWRIASVLGIDFYKLCIDDSTSEKKYIKYTCNKCHKTFNFPSQVIGDYKKIYSICNKKELPKFNCPECDGQLNIDNVMDI